MTSAFFGLEIGSRALRAEQTLVDVANQNVANANTTGYSRQSADLQATTPYPVPAFNAPGKPGQLGTGVQVADILRVRNGFLDQQYRGQSASQGRWDARSAALNQVESIFNEPSTTGLSATLSRYFEGWHEVSNSPTDLAVRTNLLQRGQAVADVFQRTSQQLQQQQRDLDQQVGITITDINSITSRIAAINVQVVQAEATGLHANDLRDQRDRLLDQLNGLAKVNSVEAADGSLNVFLSNHALVDRDRVTALQSGLSGAFTVPQFADGTTATVTDGKLAGLQQARDVDVANALAGLDSLARRTIEQVNSLHTSGRDLAGAPGLAFFTGSSAATIAVNATLAAPGGANLVAAARLDASGTFAPGDGSNATALAALQHSVSQRAAGATLQADPSQPPVTLDGGNVTVAGVDVAGATAGATFALSASGTTFTITNPATGARATFNLGASMAPGTVVLDTAQPTSGSNAASLGVRLTLRVTAAANSANVASGLAATTLATNTTSASLGDQYGSQISALGVAAQAATSQVTNQQALVNTVQRQRLQQSGVSLDEEAANLIRFQHAYQAAARVISTADSMLDTLINHLRAGS